MSPEGPVGFFDSGVGGLTVVARVLQVLPQESVLYLGDTAHVPYGSKSLHRVRSYALPISRYLVERGAKAIVIACNTSTAAALDAVRAAVPVPVLGMIESGVRAALSVVRNGKVGVLATQATVLSNEYPYVFYLHRKELDVIQHCCPDFVTLVEAGITGGPEAQAVVERTLGPMRDQGVDALVLGCTHYPYLRSAIRQVMGPGVLLVDPAQEVARALERLLDEHQLRRQDGEPPRHQYLVTGDSGLFLESARRLLGREVTVEKVDIFDGKN